MIATPPVQSRSSRAAGISPVASNLLEECLLYSRLATPGESAQAVTGNDRLRPALPATSVAAVRVAAATVPRSRGTGCGSKTTTGR
jgi:hypothetical protein